VRTDGEVEHLTGGRSAKFAEPPVFFLKQQKKNETLDGARCLIEWNPTLL